MAKLKPILVNIVEQDGWKWDFDGDLGTWAADSAWDDWKNLSSGDCQSLVQDLVDASLTKAERKKISEEDLERICEDMRENDHDNFETALIAIRDASTWAWEAAYTPSDRDIEGSIESVDHDWEMNLGEHWKLLIEGEAPEGPREWSPRPRWTESRLYNDLASRVRLERKPDYYDRFLVFDWGSSEAVQKLLGLLKRHPEEGSAKAVENELQEWSGSYIYHFFKDLDKRMQDVDTSCRVDFAPQWKKMLSDKPLMKGVREEILEFLKQPKPEEVE